MQVVETVVARTGSWGVKISEIVGHGRQRRSPVTPARLAALAVGLGMLLPYPVEAQLSTVQGQIRDEVRFLPGVPEPDPVRAIEVLPGVVSTSDFSAAFEVALADGGRLEGASRVPGSFRLPGYPEQCTIRPDTLLPMRWSRSEGSWAYVNETAIFGLPGALRGEGITVEDDPLYLLGLSVSDADTTIVFPSEFGAFNRLDLDRDLAVRLQRGLPRGTRAEITITAVDRNYVNWARGGGFNP